MYTTGFIVDQAQPSTDRLYFDRSSLSVKFERSSRWDRYSARVAVTSRTARAGGREHDRCAQRSPSACARCYSNTPKCHWTPGGQDLPAGALLLGSATSAAVSMTWSMKPYSLAS